MKNIEVKLSVTKEVYSAMLEEFRQVRDEIAQDMASQDKRLNLAVENHEYTDASKWSNISNGLYRALRVIDRKIGQLEMTSNGNG
jgi:hypothetical protein